MNKHNYTHAGMFTTALRWVVAWTYFSAFWRRLVLENKLIPDTPGYIGEKFNHFLPHAFIIKPLIEHLVSNPEQLLWSMWTFTIIEAVVGLLLLLGLFTRLMSAGVFFLAMGILLGSGWIGTTCLDEWQIGVLGVASGFILFFTGGGPFTLDYYFERKGFSFTKKRFFKFFGSSALPFNINSISKWVLSGSVLIFGLTLLTNQVFHGGVYGKLHNLSVRPHITVFDAGIQNGKLSMDLTRDEGADVYGSFLIGIQLLDDEGKIVFEQNQEDLSQLATHQIENRYVSKIKPGKHSLILPLGARAVLYFESDLFKDLSGKYTLHLIDISGMTWDKEIEIKP